MKKTNPTFNRILNTVAEPNMQTLMDKAKTANLLAKSSMIAGAKSHAYRVKINALIALKQNFPDKVVVERDWKHGSEIVLVEIPERGFGLHAPASNFGLDF